MASSAESYWRLRSGLVRVSCAFWMHLKSESLLASPEVAFLSGWCLRTLRRSAHHTKGVSLDRARRGKERGKRTSDTDVVIVGLVAEVAQAEDAVVVLALPLLGVRVEDLGSLLLLTETVELGSEDLLAVALGGEGGGVVGVDLVVLLERALEVGASGRADE